MRKMALDVGSKRIGVAISDPLNITAKPLDYIKRVDIKGDSEQINKYIEEYEVNELIIGLPLDMTGAQGSQAKVTSDYADELKKEINIPITKWDERLTTKQAEEVLIKADVSRKKRKEIIDSLAAVLILKSYLEQKNE